MSENLRLAEGKKVILHVNQHHIRQNTQDGGRRPCITVKHNGQTHYCREAQMRGPVVLRDGQDNPLSCGARIWLETYDEVVLIDVMSYEEAREHVGA
jgi:hypothetical protein